MLHFTLMLMIMLAMSTSLFVDVKLIRLTMYCLLVTEIMTVGFFFSLNIFTNNSMNVALYVKQTLQGEASSELVWSR